MKHYQALYSQLEALGHSAWSQQLQTILPARLAIDSHGKMPIWQHALANLPAIVPSIIEFKSAVEIGSNTDISEQQRQQLLTLLPNFHPWRKGPYRLFGIDLDTEWRSDWKWQRLLPHIQSLAGRNVLDVGSGNGYHGWRMLGEEANLVIGIDPTKVFVMQFLLMQFYIANSNHHVLPLGIEDLPESLALFDTVFSMGVLYHRRSPIDHLYELRACLRPGGQVVLETLVIDGKDGEVLIPEQRYAKMRNVWFIPTVTTLLIWLRRCGFKNGHCVDITKTTVEEQRQTKWMTFESLSDFLDSQDQDKTIEGYPAPKRAVFVAEAPR